MSSAWLSAASARLFYSFLAASKTVSECVRWYEVPPHYGISDLANDIIVIGAGSGGSHAAAGLACSGYRVLLIEAGQRVPQDLPADIWVHPEQGADENKKHWWEWLMQPSGLSVFGGRGEGGTSSVNGMIYTRGHRRDFPIPWSDINAAYSELDPPDLDTDIPEADAMPPAIQDVIIACQGAGLPWLGVHGINESRQGVGLLPRWRKRTTAFKEAFSKSCRTDKEGEVHVVWNTNVRQLLWAHETKFPRVEGVELFREDNSSLTVPTRHVVLAAGAIETPSLLLASGADSLCNNAIGKELQEHIGFDVIFALRTSCNGHLPTLVAFVGNPRPIHEVVFEPYCCLDSEGNEHLCFRATVILLRGTSRGSVRLVNHEQNSSMVSFALAPPDLTELGLAMHYVRNNIFGARSLAAYDPAPLPRKRFPQAGDFPNLYKHMKTRLRNFHHVAGSMSNSVDARLRLKGCQGISIADSSALLSPSTGHPDVSVRLLGRVAARYISEMGWPAWPGGWRSMF